MVRRRAPTSRTLLGAPGAASCSIAPLEPGDPSPEVSTASGGCGRPMPVAPPPRAEAAGTAGTAAAPPGTAAWRCAGVWTSTSAARSAGSRAATGRAAAGWVCHSPRAALSDSGLRPRDASRAAPTASGLRQDGDGEGVRGEGPRGSLQAGEVWMRWVSGVGWVGGLGGAGGEPEQKAEAVELIAVEALGTRTR